MGQAVTWATDCSWDWQTHTLFGQGFVEVWACTVTAPYVVCVACMYGNLHACHTYPRLPMSSAAVRRTQFHIHLVVPTTVYG